MFLLARVRVCHFAVRQAVGEGSHFAQGAASARLSRQREWAVSRLGDLSNQQMDVVNEVVDPRAARVLVHAHAPVADHFPPRVAIDRRHVPDVFGRHSRELFHLVWRVLFEHLLEFREGQIARLFRERKLVFSAVADLRLARVERNMAFHKCLIHPTVTNDFVTDGIGHGEIGLRLEQNRTVGGHTGARAARGEVDDLDIGVGLPTVQQS